MEQNFNENPHPCVGVMYPAFLNDTPAEWRDLPPDGLTTEETESMVVLRTKRVITPDDYPLPKEGHIGYVKVESKHYEGPELKPRWFDVDEYKYEAIG